MNMDGKLKNKLFVDKIKARLKNFIMRLLEWDALEL
jgi:hypothetical protein